MTKKENNLISIDASALDRIGELLKDCPAEIDKVTMQVLWSLRDDVRTGLAREIPKVYATNQKMIRSAITKERRRYVRLGRTTENQLVVEVIGQRINAVRFDHAPTRPPSGKGRTKVVSSVTILRERGVKPFKPVTGADGKSKNVFLMPTGSASSDKIPFLFARRTGVPRKSNPLKESIQTIATVAIPQMMVNPKVAEALQDYLVKQLDIRITEKLLNILTGVQRKAR